MGRQMLPPLLWCPKFSAELRWLGIELTVAIEQQALTELRHLSKTIVNGQEAGWGALCMYVESPCCGMWGRNYVVFVFRQGA